MPQPHCLAVTAISRSLCSSLHALWSSFNVYSVAQQMSTESAGTHGLLHM